MSQTSDDLQGHTSAPKEMDTRFFGHPLGLANLFGVEIWERFSFYGLQAVLVYYLYYSVTDGGLGKDEAVATAVIGAYGGLVYLACIAGGWVADRILGAEKTLLYSAIAIMAGHVSLSALPGMLGLSIGLALIAFGSGGVKTTASTVLGSLYDRADARRDGGFSIFYMGINIGALFGPLLTGFVWKEFGFHPAFLTAAFFMLVGVIQYIALRRKTIDVDSFGPTSPLEKGAYPKIAGVLIVGALVVFAAFASGLLTAGRLSDAVSAVAFVSAIVLWLQMYRSDLVSEVERKRLVGYVPMFLATSAFAALFQQQFTVLAIYTDQRLNRDIFGYEIPPAWMNSINPVFIIVFAGVFAALWTRMGKRQPTTPTKFAIGLIVIGLAPLMFLPFAGGGPNSTPFMVIVAILFVFTMSELLISPIGLSMATKLAPKAFPTRMMSLHFLSWAIGTALAGTFAGFYHPDVPSQERMFYIVTTVVMIGLGLLLMAFRKPIEKAFGGVL
ncbi:peptide MFS transporter [Corynebacterium aquilae]|uniref:Major facilitator transporter n=1 Tax=Corynebacterium aquilae DSM 44791 TaxID=1431546 RepID=A0A1L7CHD1_9CORY|nr:peptide MFS transporter [Corynebacterium aquilae]APT85256.1 major facilitator transporter [Corynebacterium aquilae DSM 44791]